MKGFSVQGLYVFSKLVLTGVTALTLTSSPATASENLQLASAGQNASIKVEASTEKRVTGAKNFVGSMAKRGIGFLSDSALSEEERMKAFEKLLNDSFDMNTIARFSLGRYWRASTAGQRKEYLSLFKTMVIDVYSSRFSEYQGQDLEVRDAHAEGKSDVIVTSYIIPKSGPEVQVDWRVRYKSGRYKVIDVIVEGVSMALTQRSDFSSVIQRGGGKVDVLISHLKK